MNLPWPIAICLLASSKSLHFIVTVGSAEGINCFASAIKHWKYLAFIERKGSSRMGRSPSFITQVNQSGRRPGRV